MTKSGKSTDSFTFLGKIYRIFDEIRRVKDRLSGPEFLSLKTSPCLSKTAQIWREKPAKPLRLRVLFRQIVQTWRENQARSRRASGSLQACADCTPAYTAHLARNPIHSQRFRIRNPVSIRNGYRVEITRNLWPRATDLRRYRLKSPPKMSETGRSV